VSDIALRPRSAPEIIDAAIQLYRRHFVPLVTLSAILNFPSLLSQPLLLRVADPEFGGDPGLVAALIGLSLFQLVWFSVMECAIVVAASERYVGAPIEPIDAIRRVMRRFGSVLGASIMKWFVLIAGTVAAGILFGFVPSLLSGQAIFGVIAIPVGIFAFLYLYARFFAVPFVVVLESIRASSALERSSVLSANRVGKILGTLVLTWLIFFLALGAMSAVGQLLGGITLAITNVVVTLASCIVYPLVAIVGMLLYYDGRVVKEGLDMELMAREIDAAAPAPSAP
jgi:hypothetical protein